MSGIAGEEASENAARLRADLVAENQGVLQNLLIHDLGVLYNDQSEF